MSFRATILTLFPNMFPGTLGLSLAGDALARGVWSLNLKDIRDHGLGRHRAVDDTPAGGGAGMVLRADVVAAAIDAVSPPDDDRPRILLTPRGTPLTQARVREIAAGPGVVLICGRFEGFDERIVRARNLEEISVGDFVLSGGEPAALILLDACVRLLPGVMGAVASGDDESFSDRLLEYPHYTRPREWEGRTIPRCAAVGRPREDRGVAARTGRGPDARTAAGPTLSRPRSLDYKDDMTVHADFIEAGDGPTVVLVHSSVSGARQWRRLIDELKPRFHVRAVNLYGYGASPTWSADRLQSLDDQAALVATCLPADDRPIAVVGHSFGGSVAMQLAMRLPQRIQRLVLLEPNPVSLLREAGRMDAYDEAYALRMCIKDNGARGDWMTAAERFADYWGGPGTWAAMPSDRRVAFTKALLPNFFEWDAVTEDTVPLATWAKCLPHQTMVVSDPQTVRPIREIVALLADACPSWTFRSVAQGGHMAPQTRPDLVNRIIDAFLSSQDPGR